jgi:integrase
MAWAEKRGNLWRARWHAPDGSVPSKPGFKTRKAAEKYGQAQEVAADNGTYVDPRAGQLTLIEWVNEWYPAQDLEPTTLVNYKYAIEVHILPKFSTWALADITAEEVGKWERGIVAQGFARRTAKDARTTLTTIFNDAIPRHVKVNPAARKRGKGRKGQRRIEHHERSEKVWATPLQVLLISERLAMLTGRDEDFVLGMTTGYTGMRWSEVSGLGPGHVLPSYLDGDALDIQWKLYELGGHFYRGRPKDGSIRPADLPPFLADLIAEHIAQVKGRRCACRKFDERPGPTSGAIWCAGGDYAFLSPGGSHYRRGPFGERYFHPAADGWYPERAHRSARRVLIDASSPFPGLPLAAWPAAVPGEEFVPPTGRGVARFVSDPRTARCAVCRRALPRRIDGLVISHKTNGERCSGSIGGPGEDVAVASWAPIIKGLTPHGLRHGLKVWMDEDQIPDVLKSERLGHDEPGMRGVYGHVSPAMRAQLRAALQSRWEDSLRQRAALSPVSAVPLLSRLMADTRASGKPARSSLAPKVGHQWRRNANRRSLDAD